MPPTPKPTPSPLQVLIVDDDPISVKLQVLTVERHWGERAQVTSFTDPQAAVLWLVSHPCEILITDLQMPRLNGLDLLRQARRQSPMIQAIFISAVPSVDCVLQAAKDGVNDFLLKPVAPTALIDCLDKAEARLIQWRATMAETLSLRWPCRSDASPSAVPERNSRSSP